MNNDNDLNLHSTTKLLGWLLYKLLLGDTKDKLHTILQLKQNMSSHF